MCHTEMSRTPLEIEKKKKRIEEILMIFQGRGFELEEQF